MSTKAYHNEQKRTNCKNKYIIINKINNKKEQERMGKN